MSREYAKCSKSVTVFCLIAVLMFIILVVRVKFNGSISNSTIRNEDQKHLQLQGTSISNFSEQFLFSPELKLLIQESSQGKFYSEMTRDTPSLTTQLPGEGFSSDFPQNGCWWSKTKSDQTKLRCIPGLYVAGFPKCGTTDIFNKLAQHPSIRKPGNGGKEIYWWSPGRYSQDLNSYTDKVTPRDMNYTREAYIMDGSPSLLNCILSKYPSRFPLSYLPPYTNADILKWVVPFSKIIATVRNPVDRSWSAYFYFHDNPPVTAESFEVDSMNMIQDMKQCLDKHSLRYCCAHWEEKTWHRRILIHGSIYVCYLVDWKLKFGNNLYLVNLDEFRDNSLHIMKDIFRWLNVTAELPGLEESLKVVYGATKFSRNEQMSIECRSRLEDFFRPYNVMLAEFFNDERFLKWNENSKHYPKTNLSDLEIQPN